MSASDRAAAIVAAIDGGIVTERPKFRTHTVLKCGRCGHLEGIANHQAAKALEGPCKCGGLMKIVGYWARLEPRGKAGRNA